MADFAVLAFKIGFLALLWLFILFVALVIRRDMIGRRVPSSGAARSAAASPVAAPPAPTAPTPPAPTRRSRAAAGQRRRSASASPRVLAIDSGKLAGQRLQLVDTVRIGRSADCELFLDDEYVTSKHPHASLTRQADGRWLLTDLGSTNGTYVDGRRISGPTIVTPADTIQIGQTQMRLER
ncbi:MAG: FHA domain-containing protein [Propionibacteriaceae bacterium]|jgi:hypothetical protein|nr:FHA domain-containing protein [Propionibacteriaceae bacterium]